MAKRLQGWLKPEILREFAAAVDWKRKQVISTRNAHVKQEVDVEVKHESNPEEDDDSEEEEEADDDDRFSDDGSNLKVSLTRPTNVNSRLRISTIIKPPARRQGQGLLSCELTDGQHFVKAEFARECHEQAKRDTSKDLEDLQDGFVSVRMYVLRVTPLGLPSDRLCLRIEAAKFQAGNPEQSLNGTKSLREEPEFRALWTSLGVLTQNELDDLGGRTDGDATISILENPSRSLVGVASDDLQSIQSQTPDLADFATQAPLDPQRRLQRVQPVSGDLTVSPGINLAGPVDTCTKPAQGATISKSKKAYILAVAGVGDKDLSIAQHVKDGLDSHPDSFTPEKTSQGISRPLNDNQKSNSKDIDPVPKGSAASRPILVEENDVDSLPLVTEARSLHSQDTNGVFHAVKSPKPAERLSPEAASAGTSSQQQSLTGPLQQSVSSALIEQAGGHESETPISARPKVHVPSEVFPVSDSTLQKEAIIHPPSSTNHTKVSFHRAPDARYIKYAARPIPKDQLELLEKKQSWLPSCIGERFPRSNVPISVVEALRLSQAKTSKASSPTHDSQSMREDGEVTKSGHISGTTNVITPSSPVEASSGSQAFSWASSPPQRQVPMIHSLGIGELPPDGSANEADNGSGSAFFVEMSTSSASTRTDTSHHETPKRAARVSSTVEVAQSPDLANLKSSAGATISAVPATQQSIEQIPVQPAHMAFPKRPIESGLSPPKAKRQRSSAVFEPDEIASQDPAIKHAVHRREALRGLRNEVVDREYTSAALGPDPSPSLGDSVRSRPTGEPSFRQQQEEMHNHHQSFNDGEGVTPSKPRDEFAISIVDSETRSREIDIEAFRRSVLGEVAIIRSDSTGRTTEEIDGTPTTHSRGTSDMDEVMNTEEMHRAPGPSNPMRQTPGIVDTATPRIVQPLSQKESTENSTKVSSVGAMEQEIPEIIHGIREEATGDIEMDRAAETHDNPYAEGGKETDMGLTYDIDEANDDDTRELWGSMQFGEGLIATFARSYMELRSVQEDRGNISGGRRINVLGWRLGQ